MDMEEQQVTVDVQEATLDLPGENKFVIAAAFLIREQAEVKKIFSNGDSAGSRKWQSHLFGNSGC